MIKRILSYNNFYRIIIIKEMTYNHSVFAVEQLLQRVKYILYIYILCLRHN